MCLLLNNMWMNIAERVTESCLVKCLKVLLGPRCRCCDSGHARHSTAQTYTSVMVSSHTLIFQKMQCSSLSVGGSLVTGNTWQGSTILLVFLVSFCYIHSCCLSHSVCYTHKHTCTCHHDNKRCTNMCGGARVRMSPSDWVQPVWFLSVDWIIS